MNEIVLQGWEVSPQELKQQQELASALNPAGILICLPKIEQSWEPMIMPVDK